MQPGLCASHQLLCFYHSHPLAVASSAWRSNFGGFIPLAFHGSPLAAKTFARTFGFQNLWMLETFAEVGADT